MSREYCKDNTLGKSASLTSQIYIHEINFFICYSLIVLREPELLSGLPQQDAGP